MLLLFLILILLKGERERGERERREEEREGREGRWKDGGFNWK